MNSSLPLRIQLFALFVLLSGCLGMPDKVKPVEDFELDRYLGRWYEIARLDHSFERGLSQVTADYSQRDDGGVSVINRGYLDASKQWKEAKGKAYFVDAATEKGRTTGYLKVSFFGPFYGSYVIFELDKDDYSYAFVSGPDLSYLWLLARTPNPPQHIQDDFLTRAEALGFETQSLIFVDHSVKPALEQKNKAS